MTKSNNTQITDILNNIYNLIVNPETTENERELLVTFKNEIEIALPGILYTIYKSDIKNTRSSIW